MVDSLIFVRRAKSNSRKNRAALECLAKEKDIALVGFDGEYYNEDSRIAASIGLSVIASDVEIWCPETVHSTSKHEAVMFPQQQVLSHSLQDYKSILSLEINRLLSENYTISTILFFMDMLALEVLHKAIFEQSIESFRCNSIHLNEMSSSRYGIAHINECRFFTQLYSNMPLDLVKAPNLRIFK